MHNKHINGKKNRKNKKIILDSDRKLQYKLNENTNEKIIEFPQKTYVSLIFPFNLKDTNDIAKVREFLIKTRNFYTYKNFISDNSRHFDHVEKVFSSENPNNYALKIDSMIRKNDDSYDSKNENFDKIPKLDEQLTESYDIQNIKCIMFSTGVFFLIYKIKIINVTEYRQYFKLLMTLKNYFKIQKMMKYTADLIGLSLDKIEAFDMQHDNTSRFQMFSEVVIGKNDSNFYKNDKIKHNFSENDCNIIANYFLNRNSVEDYDGVKVLEIKKENIFPGSDAYCTDEGLFCLTIKSKNNIDIYDNTYKKNVNGVKAVIQNLFYSYMLVLHQYYYLHYLKRKVQDLNVFDKNSKEELYKLKENYTIFQTQFMFKKVSQFYYQEKIYQMIHKTLSIEDFSKEFILSTEPLEKLLNEIRINKFDFIAKILAAITFGNALCGLINFTSEKLIGNELWPKVILKGTPVLLFISSYLIYVFVFSSSKLLKRKHNRIIEKNSKKLNKTNKNKK